MSRRSHFPHAKEQDHAGEITRPEPLAGPQTRQRSSRRSARRRRNIWFLLIMLLLGVVTIYALSGGSVWPLRQTNAPPPATSPAIRSQAQPTTQSFLTAAGKFREYPFPQADTQPMRPAIDHEGRLWFGEMGQNYLAVFDPRTQKFEQMIPPQGSSGVMAVQIAPDDTIWFVEQNANYIGHYFPTTGHYQIYPLPTFTVPDPSNASKTLTLPSAPNELALDARGQVWFTEISTDILGRLDPLTGHVQDYPLSTKRIVQPNALYGVAIDPEGMVWFTVIGSNRIGRLDPITGNIQLFTPPRHDMQPMEIVSDAQGIIWVTSFSADLLLRLDPRTDAFTFYEAPFTGPDRGGLYGLVVTSTGEIWVTVPSDNVIARLDIAAHRFIYYTIPTPGSEPLGIAMGANHTLWFMEIDKTGMLRP